MANPIPNLFRVPELKEKMKETLEEIRSGRFSQEWSTDHDEKLKLLERLKEVRAKIPFADYERRARAAFRIGSRDEDS